MLSALTVLLQNPGDTVKEKDAKFDSERRLIMYVEKNNGAYSPIETGSYMIETHFDDFLEKRKHLETDLNKKLIGSEISPIEYYRVFLNIGIADLASRVGISSHKVKKHMTPEHFGSIKIDLIQKYADVFRVPVANLFQLFDLQDKNISLKQEKTQNPFISINNIRNNDLA